MVIYTKEEKTLIIPEGLGVYNVGDCTEAVKNAYESGYTEGYQSGITADCGEAIEDAYNDGYASGTTDGYNEGYSSGYTAGLNDCSGGTCNLGTGDFGISDFWGGNTIISASASNLDGFSEFRVFDQGYGTYKYQSGYTAGYQEGLNDCSLCPCPDCDEMYESGYTEGYQSGYTQGQADCPECDCTEECNNCYNQGYADGRESVTSGCPMQSKSVRMSGVETTVTPDYGYAGMDSVYVSAEDIYNDAYSTGYTEGYQSGYTTGLNDCSGSTCHLQQKNYSLTEVGAGSWSVQPDAGYDGMSSLTIYDDAGYGESLYQRGYAAGQADCSGTTPSLQRGEVSLGYDWTGFTWTYPDTGYDGFSDVIVADTGYGQAKYDAGYSNGYTEGVNAEIGEASSLYIYFNTEHPLNNSPTSGRGITINGSAYTLGKKLEVTGLDSVRYAYEGELGVKYITPSEITVAVYKTDVDNWGEWNVEEVRFNGEVGPNSEWVNRDYNGGFRFVPTNVTYASSDENTYIITISLSGTPTCDCSSAITEAYQSGYTAGVADEIGEFNTLYVELFTEHPTLIGEQGVRTITCNNSAFTVTSGNETVAQYHILLSYVGNFDNKYITPEVVTLRVLKTNVDAWGEWKVNEVRFNGEYNNGYISGGFKYVPTDVTVNTADPTHYDIVITLSGTSAVAYQSGYTAGYSDGYADGLADCASSSAVTEAYESGVTEGQGTVGTLKIEFNTQNSYIHYYPSRTYPTITGYFCDSGDTHIGTYDFNYGQYNTPPYVWLQESFEYNTNKSTYGIKGIFSGAPAYASLYAVSIDICDENLDNWGTFDVKVTLNPEFVTDGVTWDFAGGGYKMPIASEDHSTIGTIPNSHKVIIYFGGYNVTI